MGYLESCRLGIGLALCLAWVAFGTTAQGDAISESPFTLVPPSGWERAVIENGTVRFVDPKNQDCLLFIKPHASNLRPEIDESSLRTTFDTERDTVIKRLKESGLIFLNEVNRPVLERIANRTYAIHGSFRMKKIENGKEKIGNFRILLLIRRESIQELISVADYSACDDDVIVDFFNKAISNIENVNANAEKRPASLREIRLQSYRNCLTHCTNMFIICNISPPPGGCEDCSANCRPPSFE